MPDAGTLAALALAAALSHGATAADCEALTDLDVAALETFQFESAGAPWRDLPRDAEYRLGRITVVRQDVFEQEEGWLQRTANRYHPRTRERVILSVLPMRSGDRVNQRLLAEAERILRGKVYFYDARVIPERVCGDVLDVFVVTRDVWTLTPRVALVRSGGENEVGLGISDTNLLGSGRSLLLGYEKDQDRRGVLFAYSDPNVYDSRWALDVGVMDSNDGERYTASLRIQLSVRRVRAHRGRLRQTDQPGPGAAHRRRGPGTPAVRRARLFERRFRRYGQTRRGPCQCDRRRLAVPAPAGYRERLARRLLRSGRPRRRERHRPGGNVGVGLRLESTRTRGDLILHLDAAVPLRDGPDVRNVEIALTAKQSL